MDIFAKIFTKGAILLTIFMLVISSFLFLPQRVYAQFIVSNPIDQIGKAIKWAWEKGGAVAYRNAINFFLQQAAKQSAEYLATGEAGKKPMFWDNPEEFIKNARDQVLGEFVDGMAGSFLGESLCDTLDPTVKFKILANLDPDYQKMQWAKEPKCSWSQIKKNLKEIELKDMLEFSADVREGKVAKQRSGISTVIQGDSVLPNAIKYYLDGKVALCPEGNWENCPAGTINWLLGNTAYFYEEGTGGIGAYLHKYTNEFEDILKGLEEAAPGESKIREEAELGDQGPWGKNADKVAETIKKHAAERFKDLQENIKNNVWGGDKEKDPTSWTHKKLLYYEKYTAECAKQNVEEICGDNRKEPCWWMCFECDASSNTCNGPDCIAIMKRANKYTKQLVEWATTLEDMIAKAIKNWEDQQGLPDLDPLEDAENMFNPESNPMGIQMELKNKLFKKQADAIEKSKFFRSVQGSMNAVTSKISGLVKLPSTFVSEKVRESVKAGTASPLTTTGVAFADAIGVFANTFLTQYAKVFIKGLNPAADSGRVNVPVNPLDPPNPDTTSILSDIKVIPINQTSNEMTIYDEFAICPTGTDQKYTSQFNCLLDNKLARAVEERMTIQEAMANRLLNPEERLGIRGDKSGLLSKNHIQKLRLIGVLPLGAQIASEIIMKGPYTNGVTLYEVVDGFDKRGENGVCGDSDIGESEFCNLIDPNWVLKAPSYLCEISGYSAIPLCDSSFRQESCLDLKTCINESEGNQCDTWSYCTREKNIWRFGGDECEAQYNTCASYIQEGNGKVFSYLSNTLDFESCSASNVGCKWYCSNWDQNYSGTNGNWSCLSPGWRKYTCYLEGLCDGASCSCTCNGDNGCPNGLGSCDVVEGGMSCSLDRPELRNVAFFSSHIQECREVDKGCSQYIRTKSGLGVNFLPNGSFELPSQDNGIPLGWQANGPIQQITPSSNAQHGSNVVQIQAEAASIYQLSQRVNNVPLQGDFIVSGYYKKNSDLSGDYNLKLQICYDDNDNCDEAEETIELDNNNWQYVSVSLSSDIGKSIDHIKVFAFDSSNFSGDIYIDTLQLRNETGNSDYREYREYGSRGIAYLKSAPDWMNCYDGNPSNNHSDCDNFIQECAQKDVGCELYTPIDNNSSSVPAIIDDKDECDSVCLGYETFQEMPTNFDNNQRLVDLIPSTAQKCSAPGCEEFTNLDAVSIGGEGKEYYTYLRQCVKTNAQGLAIVDSMGNEISPASADTCQYYYTWVGEETNGYQLKKYYLKANDLGGPAQVSATPNPDWGSCAKYNGITNEDDCFANNYVWDGTGCLSTDALDNPHCRQFYDAMGNIYYRFYKNTITCSMDCSPYRRAVDSATYMAIGSEGEVCNASDVGCREYKGSAYGNMKNLFSDRFISNFEPWENVDLNDESISYLGHSIKAEANLAQRPVNGLVQKGKVYSLSLWVKGSGDYIASFGNDLYFITDAPHNISVVSNEWQEIKFGSIYFNREPESNEALIIQGPDGFYLDNIVLNEVQDNIYLIKNSWNTPPICDIDSEGNILQGYELGCQAYWDRGHNPHYLKSFSRLCSEKAVGCEAMIDTQNSTFPFTEEFNSGSPQGDEIVIPSDSLVYRIYDVGKSCSSENKGCQRFGLPELDSDQKAIDFTDVYLLNNPDLYELQSTLCDIEGEGCQEYEGEIYFKDPGDNVCEYRENVLINGENKNGWFRKGTNHPCYMENGFAYQPYGTVYGIRSKTDPLYEGIAGVCPESQNGCTRFVNPVEQNLVLNSGFEENGDNWNGINIITDDDCLAGHCLSAENNISIYQNISGNYDIGNIYELSAWLKTDGDGVEIKTILKYIEANGDAIDSEEVIYTGSTEGNWERQTVELAAPSQASKIQVRFEPTIPNANEKILIDNVSLIEKNSPKGSYYYLNNDNIDSTSCNVMAGLKEGCVLFNDTSISGNLPYDSAYTYALSHIQGDISIPAQSVSSSSGGEGDSNVVLKVRRDRVCGEWLQCSGYRSVWDNSISEFRSICDSWVRCDQLIGSGKMAQCGHIVYDPNPSVLDKTKYINRDISWSGMDYSGYSIPNMYPIERLLPSEDTDNPGLYRLTYFEDRDDDGTEEDIGVDGLGLHIEKTARVYPEKGSPFKHSAIDDYNEINLCDSGEGADYPDDNLELDEDGNVVFRSLYPDCQGSYLKVEYGDKYSGLTKYYNFDAENVEDRKVCKYSGKDCTNNESVCATDNPGDVCVSPNKITKVIGLRGFCLETDKSKPDNANACITWWPGASVGDVDVYNLHYSAGYVPDSGRNWYCASDDGNPIFGDSVIAFNSSSNSFCYNHSGTKERYILLDGDSCPVDWECKVASPIPFNVIKMGEIEKIEVKLGADDGENCSSLECNKKLVLDSSNRYWESIQYNDPLVGSSDCNNRSTWPDNTTFPRTPTDGWHGTDIRACFDAECLDTNFANWTYDEESYLHHFIWHSYDRSSSGGGGGKLHWIKIYLKNGCKYLVNAVPANNDGLSIAYTDRLWEGSAYYSVVDPPNTPGTGGTECIPYGAADITAPGRLTFVGDNPAPNPYECESNKANIVYNLNDLQLQQLFVKVDEVREFFKNTMNYGTPTNYDRRKWNLTEDADPDYAPRVASVQCLGDACIEKEINKISIGDSDSGDIISMLSPFAVNLKFYAWADTNHMPIREVSIDWDDDTPVNFYNVISKNHRSSCEQPNCGDPTDYSCWEFGLTPQACTDKYYVFNHTYICGGPHDPNWNAYNCDGVCCFKPKVYIKDNWGWCAGNPEGVYAGWNGEIPNKCSKTPGAGISYDGIIKVNANN
ncbi:hypothetical protein B6D52_00250 [Candidatus Parcubacteria bacterium 4484_255]|nr:MAG: hypothetical protein B6D52_00250 [Candidatus Parcubacteria bacterium 4484_255]